MVGVGKPPVHIHANRNPRTHIIRLINPMGSSSRNLLVLLVLCTAAVASIAAFTTPLSQNPVCDRSSFRVFAKKASNKKKKTKGGAAGSVTGGFGKQTVADQPQKTKIADDYSLFPALEPQVSQTLLQSPPALLERGVLSLEAYDRLDQIYGFPNFNYETTNDSAIEDPVSLSLVDMISADDGPGTATELPSSRISDADFSDLLAAATGAEAPPLSSGTASESTSKQAKSTKLNEISELPKFNEFRVLHMDPLVLAIDDFFSNDECDRYIQMSTDAGDKPSGEEKGPMQIRSRTVGKDANAKAQRTSTTWFHHYSQVPELMSKACRLLGLESIDKWEEPQTVRYRRNEKFTWHLDALSPDESTSDKGGQRTATLLVYLTEMGDDDGGATVFRDLSETSEGGKLRV